jgi:DNA-binding NtrC family response regulator
VPVGSTTPIPVNVRFMAATHQDLTARIRDGRFRDDLYGRLTGFQLRLPPLRERPEDLGQLVAATLRDALGAAAAEVRFRASAVRAMFAYAWPRNVRELDNAIRAALVLAGDREISIAHLPSELRDIIEPSSATPTAASSPATPRNQAAPANLRATLLELHRRHRGNISVIARELGKARSQIQRWNKRFDIDPALFRGPDDPDDPDPDPELDADADADADADDQD